MPLKKSFENTIYTKLFLINTNIMNYVNHNKIKI